MKKLLTITALTLTVIIGGVVWYVQNTSTNHQNTVIARSETTKQFRSNTAATTTPSTTNTAANTQNHNTTTDTAIRYNADGSIDTSNWQEYCNQEYGFCVKYPQGWVVEKYKSSDEDPILDGLVDCGNASNECPFENIRLYNSRSNGMNKNKNSIEFLTIHVLSKNNPYFNRGGSELRTAWMQDLITGCAIDYFVRINDSTIIMLHTFYDTIQKKQCKNGYNRIFDAIIKSFRAL